jgi:small GTP-binding protein
MRLLNDQQEEIVKKERLVLGDLHITLTQFGADANDILALSESISQLDELFLLVVVGEFNAGKSAFINALLGSKLLPEGVTPTTTQINLLRYGQDSDRTLIKENILVVNLPVEWLADISIVDTPGTNAILRSHEAITTDFIPRSDIVIFLTSADRPFTESERTFLERIRDWGKKIVIVINKIDILESDQETQQVVDFVSESASKLLGLKPEIFPISSRQALRAKQSENSLWELSRFEPLENYILKTLDEKSRFRLKLLNPLGVSQYLVNRYHAITSSRLDLLKDDIVMLSDVDAQLVIYKDDMGKDFNYRIADVENLLYEMEQRGQEFFDNTFRLARVVDLFNKDRIRQEFERQVIADAPQEIEVKINALIDWLVESDLRQWQAVNDHLAERRRAYQERIIGDLGPGNFTVDRERVMDSVGREAQRVVDSYDKTVEASNIAASAQEAVAASAVLEVGAVGLGALVAILASTVAADVTGILLATFIAALGLVIIPARRRTAKNEMHKKISALRLQLTNILRIQFEREIQRSLQNIQNAIAPYTRFVRAEQSKLLEIQSRLSDSRLDLINLREKIEKL